MSEVIGSVQVVVRPDTTGFAEKARDGIERQFKRKNALELDFQVDPDSVRRDVEDARDLAQKWLDLKKNALKVKVGLDWKKTDLVSQLRDFKNDVEALEKLQRPTVYANFEVDRKSIDKIREDIKLNVTVDSKALKKSIEKATKDISVFGDKKAVERNTKKAAEFSSQVFKDIFQKRKLKVEIDADTKKVEEAQVAMEKALGVMVGHKSRLADLEEALDSVNDEVKKQSHLVDRLNEEWLELEESGEANAKQFAYYANSLRDAEDTLKSMVKEQEKLRWRRDNHANNIFAPSLDGAERLKREFEALESELDDKKVKFTAAAERVSFTAVAAEVNAIARDRIITFHARIRKNSIAQLERQMAALSRHSKDFGTNIAKYLGQLAGVRVLWRTFRDMIDWLPRLDMMVPQLAQNFALLTGAVSGTVGALGLAFTLLSDIGEVGKLVLALPALLTGAVGSALIIGRAIQDFKTVFPEIINFYERLGDIVSDRVWKQAAGPIRELHAATAPLLSAHVPNWAAAWGDAMGALAKGAKSKSSLLAFEKFLENSIEGTKKATKGWESLGGALMNMLGAGSEVFPELGAWFSDTMEDFRQWTAMNAGNIGDWIREGATALRELGSIGVSVVKIIAGVADAFGAAGWPGLTELERGMRAIGDAALNLKNNEGFMQTLEQIRYFFEQFDGLGLKFEESWNKLWGMIGDSAETLARPMANALAYILDGFNSAKFQNGFGTFITGIASFIDDIGPGLGAVTEEIGSLLGVVGTAAKSWGPAFNDMLLLFSDAGDSLHPGLLDFVENLGPRLQDLVTDITPHVEDFATALGNLLGNENFQDLIGDLIGDIGTLAGALLDLGKWVLDVAGKFSDWYGGLSDGQQDFVRWTGLIIGFAGGALGLLAGAVFKVMGLFKKLGGAFKFLKLDKLFGGLKDSKAGKSVGGFFKNIADDIALRAMYLWDKIKGVGTRIGGALRNLPGAIGRGASALWSGLKGLGTRIGGALRGLGEGIGRAASALGSKVQGIGASIGNALRGIWTNIKLFPQWLSTKFTGLANTIKNSRLGITISNAFKGLFDKIKIPSLGGAGGLISKITKPIGEFIKKIPGALGKVIPKGGLLKLVGKALSRFIPVAGWGLLIKDIAGLIKPIDLASLADRIVDALGLEDTWLGRLTENLKTGIDNLFGDKSLVDIAWDYLKSAWENFTSGDILDGIGDLLKLISPIDASTVFAEAIIKALGLENTKGGQNTMKLLGTLRDDGLGAFFSEWWDLAKTQLSEGWDSLVDSITSWEPVAAVIDFFENPWETIKGWLGLSDSTVATALSADQSSMRADMDFSKGMDVKIPQWLGEAWDKLVGFIKEWNPISLAFKFGTWLGEKIADWLGLEGGISLPTISELANWGSDLWNNTISPALSGGWDALVGFITEWNPISLAFKFGTWIGEKVASWLGLDALFAEGIPSLDTIKEWGSKVWNNKIQPYLSIGWNALVNFFQTWSPIGIMFRFGTWLSDKIKGWLGIEGDLGLPDIAELAAWGTDLWNNKIQPKLQSGWDAVIGFIREWNPVSLAFKFGTWIGDKIKEWLGINPEGGLDLSGFSLDFDFSSLWEEKIKPALTNGLLALAGLILAPGLVLIAPLALPTLIIGWLLGRDGEGNWSFQELTNKITGAWEKIKGALTSGVETVVGLIGGLVMTPIAIGTKIVDWVLGSDWVEKAKNGLTTAINNAAPALNSAIETGLGAIGTAASGPGTAGAKAGGALRRALGIDEPGKGKIRLDFDHIGGLVTKFGGNTRSEYSDTSTSVGGSTREMSNKAKANFDKMRHDAKSSTGGMKSNTARDMANMSATAAAKAAQMQANVVRKMTTMQTQAGAKAAVMQRNVVRSMTQANVLGVRQATVMATAYVAAMNRLASGAARVASSLRGTLPNLLRINAGGAGNYTGNSFVSGLSRGLSRAVGVARGMAGRIRSALSFNVHSSGAAVGSSFASGLRSRIGSVGAAASALAAAARSRMPNSPADEGPFSGKGWGGWGESIAEELARGLRMGAPKVAREASRMMASTAAELNQTSQVSFTPDVKSISRALSTGEEALIGAGSGTTVNVNVTSRSEDPLQDGNRFGGDIAFALRGAGLA